MDIMYYTSPLYRDEVALTLYVIIKYYCETLSSKNKKKKILLGKVLKIP